MKTIFNTVGSIIRLVVIVGIGIILALTLKRTNPQNKQVPTFQSPIEKAVPAPTDTPTLTQFSSPIKPTATPYAPPLCTFNAKTSAERPVSTPSSDKYVFSEPKVIFSREGAIDIIEWLPDNQRLLLYIRNQTEKSIEVLNTTTGKTEVYADNLQNANRIHWVPDRNAVVYNEHKTVRFSGIDQDGIWLSTGKQHPAELLLDDAKLFESLTNAKALPPDIAPLLNVYDFPFDPYRWLSETERQDKRFARFSRVVSPDNAKALFMGVPRLYLVDLKTNQPCQVDWGLDGYHAYTARWDTEGRYVAMLVSNNAPGELMYFNKPVILDALTGQIYKPEMTDWSHIWDYQWFPDNRHLIVMGLPRNAEQPFTVEQIGIADISTENIRLIIPDYIFTQGSQSGFQLALSPDGKKLVVNCPVVSDKYSLGLLGQVCLITIH